MGFLAGLFGGNGSNFQAEGLSPSQLQNSMNQVLSGLGQQQSFLTALQNQGGVGNQSNVFGQQQALANQLGQQAGGGGPNPALAQLANTTGQNVSNQAALMAGQRGVSANPGLAARNIAQSGAAQQQQSVGQAAALRAQQQLAAQQQLQQQQAQMAGLATQQVGQQAGALQNLQQSQLANQGQLLGMQQNMNNANAGIASTNAQGQQGLLGGALTGLAGGLLALNKGGQVPQKMADGGTAGMGPNLLGASVGPQYGLGVDMTMPTAAMPEKLSSPDKFLDKYGAGLKGALSNQQQNAQNPLFQGASSMGQAIGSGIRGLFSQGGKIHGQAKVKGDSETNDTVPALLSPGEVVIPRSKVGDEQKTAKFINAVLGMNLSPRSKS